LQSTIQSYIATVALTCAFPYRNLAIDCTIKMYKISLSLIRYVGVRRHFVLH